ncbi:sugar transferase [Gammaproteobacteria bacterium]|nr:sugar transferase [Gammaproteobacteria bacterium]
MIRILDIFFATLGLFVLGIFMLGATLINLCTGEHKVLYKQNRVGKDGEDFRLYKFATMLENSPNLAGGLVTAVNDPRVLPFGKFLRRTKVNELPQLLNILLGDMSFVGPRPQTRPHYSLYTPEQRRIIDAVGPGLTGVGSLFFRNEEEILANCEDPIQFHDEIITPFKGDLEVWFAQHRSLKLYLVIIYLTAASIINRKLVTIKYFKGLPTPPAELLEVLTEGQRAIFSKA